MNTPRQTLNAYPARLARFTSVVMSVFMTLTILGGIDRLTQRDMVADSLMAQAVAKAAATRG